MATATILALVLALIITAAFGRDTAEVMTPDTRLAGQLICGKRAFPATLQIEAVLRRNEIAEVQMNLLLAADNTPFRSPLPALFGAIEATAAEGTLTLSERSSSGQPAVLQGTFFASSNAWT